MTFRRSSRNAPALQTTSEPERPVARGFSITIGVILAITFALAVFTLRGIAASVLAAMFIAVAINPLIHMLQRRGMRRSTASALAIVGIIAIVVGVLVFAVPALERAAADLITSIPAALADLTSQEWFIAVDAATSGGATAALTWFATLLTSPSTWLFVSGGVLGFGFTILSGVSAAFFVMVLSIYFIISYENHKRFAYSLVSASRREAFAERTDRILSGVGRYLSGMVVLAFMNATYSTILLLAVGVKGALLIGFIAFFITIIPLIGTVLTTIAITIITLFQSPTDAIVVLIFMLVYMQIEAYIFTPRVMSKAVQVPGSVVLIASLAGGTLLGLPGALIGVPVAASISLLISEVIIPRRQLK